VPPSAPARAPRRFRCESLRPEFLESRAQRWLRLVEVTVVHHGMGSTLQLAEASEVRWVLLKETASLLGG